MARLSDAAADAPLSHLTKVSDADQVVAPPQRPTYSPALKGAICNKCSRLRYQDIVDKTLFAVKSYLVIVAQLFN